MKPSLRVARPPFPLAKAMLVFADPGDPDYPVAVEIVVAQPEHPEQPWFTEPGWLVHRHADLTIAVRVVS